MQSTKYMLNSNNINESQCKFSSTKKKTTTPALLFCKSIKNDSTYMNENNSSLINSNHNHLSSNNSLLLNQKINKEICSPLSSKENTNSKNNLFSNKAESRRFYNFPIKQSIHFCENHFNKTATYVTKVYDSNVQYYCEKCAILLASKGFSVQKLSDSFSQSRINDESISILNASNISYKSNNSSKSLLNNSRMHNINNRRQQINNFLFITKDLMNQIQKKKQETRENLIQSEQFYGAQIQEVNEYFQLVFKSLELQKNKCYNYILNQRLQVEQPVRAINDLVGQLKDKIQTIIEDIQQNIQTVYQTADDIYRPVIEQYHQNYQEIRKRISQIEIYPVQMRKIDFQGVPQSIFYISDLLKDSLQNQTQFIQNQKKMNDQLNSLRQSMKQSLPNIEPRKLFSKRSTQHKMFTFSFQAQALKQQLSGEKISYQNQQ